MPPILTADLLDLCVAMGRLDEALTLAEKGQEYTRLAGYGPWTHLAAERARLQILSLQGHSQEVLNAVTHQRAIMDEMPETSNQPEAVAPWDVREGLLDTGRDAAINLEKWQQALDINAEIWESRNRRGAPVHELARVRFNDYGPLLHLGRVTEARDLLLEGLSIFEAISDIRAVGKVLSALATVEKKLAHEDAAVRFEKDALRLSYAARRSSCRCRHSPQPRE